jgi:hypothetical protein
MQDTTKQTPYETPKTDIPRDDEKREMPETGTPQKPSWEQPQGQTGYGGDQQPKKHETGTDK